MDENKIVEIAEEVEKRVKALFEKAEADIAALEAKDQEIATLTQKVADLEGELEAKAQAVATAEEAVTAKDEKISELESEVVKYQCGEAIRELNEAIGGFTPEQQEAAKEEIDAFNADPMNCGYSVSAIKQKIEACAYQALVAAKAVEVNSATNPSVVETIVTEKVGEYDFDKIFVE